MNSLTPVVEISSSDFTKSELKNIYSDEDLYYADNIKKTDTERGPIEDVLATIYFMMPYIPTILGTAASMVAICDFVQKELDKKTAKLPVENSIKGKNVEITITFPYARTEHTFKFTYKKEFK